MKFHLRATINGKTVCASRPAVKGKVRPNARGTYATIPVEFVLSPEEFRAAPDARRCMHCCDRFTEVMNARRAVSGKPPYKNAMTKELA
jgi:hypothetical protein